MSSLPKSTLHRKNRDREGQGNQHKGEEQEEDLVRDTDTRSNVRALRSGLTVLLSGTAQLAGQPRVPVFFQVF